MNSTDFMVGDVISYHAWFGDTYTILKIEDEWLYLIDSNGETIPPWNGWKYLVEDLEIFRKTPESTRASVEKKIAHLDQLFKNRNKEK